MGRSELTLRYSQASGQLVGLSKPYRGYSGFGGGKNNPDAEGLVGYGPIPKGLWLATRCPHTRKGPVAFYLHPVGHDAKGRTEFMIHGDSIRAPGTASRGCIVLERAAREEIAMQVRLVDDVLVDVI